MASALDQRAQNGFAKAAHYDAHRPTYPEESVQHLLENVRVAGKTGAEILDLAAGTGKFTELLARRDESYKIVAVEPHADMRKVLEDKHLPGVEVKDGLSTSIPLPDESVDAVIVAQAFHWFANMDSLRELHRVLRPHGCLGMIWNAEEYNSHHDRKTSTTWEQTMQDYIWTQEDDQPRFRHQKWKQVFDEQIQSGPLALIVNSEPLFSLPVAMHEDPWTVFLPQDKVWDRLTTLSHIAILQGEERECVHKKFLDAVASEDTQRNDKGDVAVHGGTIAAWTSKIPASGATKLWEKQA